ncbi:MAG TPA: acido-empty-quinoprotein group A [Vicinamibacterales bacterium]|nr:acido-empty-quinoprotein group A [Vicinamibacterales bacterium]
MNRTFRMRRSLFVSILSIAPIVLTAQGLPQGGLDPASLLTPLRESWTTYSGDYSGRRYSALTEIDQSTVKNLGLAWVVRLTAGLPNGTAGFGGGGRGGGRGGFGGAAGVIVGGEGAEEFAFSGAPTVKGAVLKVGDVLYVTAPDNVWALDVHDGHQLWRYFWKTRGGTHIGNRGAAMWHNDLFFETPDDYLVSLDARTGKERWHVELASFNEEYFSTAAPVVVGDRVLVGTGNDTDMPGFLQSFDPETGKLQWKTYMVPMNPGDPGLDTWPSLEAARHGGAQTWIPGAYDPETKLYIIGTGNPTPAYTAQGRKGDNLFTCSLVAINVETGKIAWYYQTSPHDTHDWDSAQTPILIDGVIDGRPRKLVSTASRNGYFFTVDRLTGKAVATAKFGTTMNWVKGVRPNGAPEPDSGKEATVPGSLVSPVEGGVTNWPPPAFSPDTGLFYVHEHNGFNLLYLTEPDPRGSMGLAGKTVGPTGSWPSALRAIDYKTGKAVWRHEFPGGGGAGGVLATAGKLVFTGDAGGNLVAFDATNGTPLWHTHIGGISNAPETFSIDGKQHVLVAVGDTLYAFALY